MASTTYQSLSMGLRGTIITVTDAKSAKKAQEAGACAVVLSYCEDGRRRMEIIEKIKKSVSIPVIATCRIGHSGEAHVIASQLCGVHDYYIQETSTTNAPVDVNVGPYIDKHDFNISFVCLCSNLSTALKRVSEGASLLKIINKEYGKFESIVKDVRKLNQETRNLNNMDESKLVAFAKQISVPYDLVKQTKKLGRLPVPLFASYVDTPENAVMMMQLGVDGVYISGCSNSNKDYFSTMVKAVKHYDDPKINTMLYA